MLEGEGGIHTGGGRSARGILVEITDETGRPVDGAAVSFRLPEDGPGGTFAHGMRTEIVMTGPDGRAGFREFLPGRTTGPFQVRVTAVRDGVRAGTVIDQYIAEPTAAQARAKGFVSSSGTASESRLSKKWIIWLAVAGVAVAAGLAAGASSGSGGAATGPPPVVAVPPPTVGPPAITIGRPQ
ncbi:MAG: hypothetical protein SGI92_06280 [Bryobacteraceae bacterium]|nr:hypothetical protein [Bryobacteraceae bacterium]